nr:solute carrier family 23 protein [Loigolactobacillus coryniformis]
MKKVKNNSTSGLSDEQMLYQLEGRPRLSIAFPMGLQHVLAMFAGNLAPMLIIAAIAKATPAETVIMIQAGMLISGLATLLQLYPIKIGRFQIGSGLPFVMGTSFAFVPTCFSCCCSGWDSRRIRGRLGWEFS